MDSLSLPNKEELLYELEERVCVLCDEERKIFYELTTWNNAWREYNFKKRQELEQKARNSAEIMLQEVELNTQEYLKTEQYSLLKNLKIIKPKENSSSFKKNTLNCDYAYLYRF